MKNITQLIVLKLKIRIIRQRIYILEFPVKNGFESEPHSCSEKDRLIRPFKHKQHFEINCTKLWIRREEFLKKATRRDKQLKKAP
eukprot:8202436-Heterocapsa_arctica.AAC.1